MAPTQAQIDAILLKAKADIDALFTTAPKTVSSNLQAAINAAASGASLTFTGVETGPVVISKPLTLTGGTLRGGLTVSGLNVSLNSVEVHKDQARDDIVVVTGDNCTAANCKILGHPTLGQKRGIAANGANIKITGCTVDDIFDTQLDAQAIAAWDTPGPILIENCFLRASGETVLIGGADPSSQARQPANLTLRSSLLTKRIEWKGTPVLVKNAFELKNLKGGLIEGNTFEYSWTSGQQGYLLVLTPRNQDGNAPYSCVQDVVIRGNTFRHGAAAISVLGSDNEKPSGPLARVSVLNNTFDDIDPHAWNGSDQMIQIIRGSQDLTISGNTFTGKNIGSVVYFADLPKSTNLTITNNVWPTSTYGVFGADSAVGSAWGDWVESGVLSGNVEK